MSETEDLSGYEADLEEGDNGATAGKLARVMELARDAMRFEAEVAFIESELAAAKEKLRRALEADLPEALSQCGLRSCPLEGGGTVTLVENVTASIPKDLRADAYAWLEGHGMGDIVKRTVTIAFRRGEQELAASLVRELKDRFAKNTITEKELVAPQTLAAYAREQVAKNADLPESLGVTVLRAAKITRPAAEKAPDAF